MKSILKYILITLFCISRIKSACTGTDVAEAECDASCKWTKSKDACLGVDNGAGTACNTFETSDTCKGGTCNWGEVGTCADKTCADYKTDSTCNNADGCEWSDGTCVTETPATSCADNKDQTSCNKVDGCEWSNNACGTKTAAATCADYKTESSCKAVSTCEWSNNACATKSGTTTTPTTDEGDDDGVFCLKSSILIFLLSFLF